MSGDSALAGRSPALPEFHRAATAPTAGLNGSHALHVFSTFQHVDGLLASIEKLARSDLSPLAPERPDVAPDEARLLLASVAAARRRMLEALDRLGIVRPEPSVSARWGIQTAFLFAEVSLSDLDAAGLRGYGAASPAAARELEALASDLTVLMRQGAAIVREVEQGGLKARVASLEGNAGEVLRALERLSTEHGLVELRSLIAAAAERAVATTFDVGVFGRVSTGKSSLINALAGTPVLPVDATPATAVPLRVRRGPLGGEIQFLDDSHRSLAVAEMAEFATERGNPENRRGVRAIEIQAPTVPEGLRFLDTPGVGSLTTSGPAQAFAWLPRCDLGLVLIAAGGPVGPDDVALVAGLTHAGIVCRVLLSKCDLLSADERDRTGAYVARELAIALGPAFLPEIHSVSTLAAYRPQLEALQQAVLEPLGADHIRAAEQALRARLHRLVAATAAALEGRRLAPSHDQLLLLHSARVAAAERIEQETEQLAGASERVIENAADILATAWARREPADAQVRAVLQQAAGRALAAVREAADSVRTRSSADTGEHRIPPLFDPDFLGALPDLAAPRLGGRLAGRMLAGRRLEPVAQQFRAALNRYASRLRAWGLARLGESATALWSDEQPAESPEHGVLTELDALIERAPTDEARR